MEHSVRNPLPVAAVADLEAQGTQQGGNELPAALRSVVAEPANTELIRRRALHLLIFNVSLGAAMMFVLMGSLVVGRSVGYYFSSNVIFFLVMLYGVGINLLRCADVRRQLVHLHILAVLYLLGALASLVLGIVYATQAGDRMQNYCAAHSSACPDDLEGLKSAATLMSTFAMFFAITVLLVGFRLANHQVNAIFTSLDSTYSPVTARLAFARGQRVVIPGEVPRFLFFTVLSASNITRVTVEGLRTLFSSCSRCTSSECDCSASKREDWMVRCCGFFCFAFIVVMIVAIVLCAGGSEVWCTVATVMLELFVAFLVGAGSKS